MSGCPPQDSFTLRLLDSATPCCLSGILFDSSCRRVFRGALVEPPHNDFTGWEVSRQRVGNAFGVRYEGSTRAFYIELPYFSGTVQSRQRPKKSATKPATLPCCRLTSQTENQLLEHPGPSVRLLRCVSGATSIAGSGALRTWLSTVGIVFWYAVIWRATNGL